VSFIRQHIVFKHKKNVDLVFRTFIDLENWKVSYQYELSAHYQKVRPTYKILTATVSNNICTVTNNGIWVSEGLAVGFAMCRYCKARCYLRLGIRNGADRRARIFCHICVPVHDNKACGKKFHHRTSEKIVLTFGTLQCIALWDVRLLLLGVQTLLSSRI
jgi:hypothetical protein